MIFCTRCLIHEAFECVWLFTEGKIPLFLATNGNRDLTLANTYVTTWNKFCNLGRIKLQLLTVVPCVSTRFHKGCGLVVETRENGRYRWVWMCLAYYWFLGNILSTIAMRKTAIPVLVCPVTSNAAPEPGF